METKTHRILRLILFLSTSYSKTKEECRDFLGIKDSAFYNYCNVLKDTGFELCQKEGKYWIEYPDQDHQVLRNVLHFTEEESYLLSLVIEHLEEKPGTAIKLKQKLASFLNQDKAIETYIQKEKSEIVLSLHRAQQQKKKILLINYASGNSLSVRNRMVEPFEFKDDFTLVWAFDIGLKQNRQFKICRMEDVLESQVPWEFERLHRSKPVDIFRNTGDLNKWVECQLSLKAKNLLVEEYPLAERFLTKHPDNRYMLKVQVAKYEGPGRFVLGLSEDVKPLGDVGFMDYLEKKMVKCQQLFSHFAIHGVEDQKFG